MAVTKLKITLLIFLCITVASVLLHKYSIGFCDCRFKIDVKHDGASGLTSDRECHNTTQSATDCYPLVSVLSKAPSMITHTAATNTTKTTYEHCFLLTMVVSAPKNRDRRNIIRRTWVNSYASKDKRFLVKFVVGTFNLTDKEKQSLFNEDEEHKDMLLLAGHLDSYHNLTKKVLHMFVWADRSVDFSYLLKTDDDCFANLDALESELKARNINRSLYWGYILHGIWPKKEGKWKEDKWDICESYLPYAMGGGYVLSADLIHRLAVNADSLIFYSNEDVSIGAWVSPFVLERKFDDRFGVTGAASLHNCKEYLLLILHDQCIENMKKIHHSMKSTGKICKMKS